MKNSGENTGKNSQNAAKGSRFIQADKSKRTK